MTVCILSCISKRFATHSLRISILELSKRPTTNELTNTPLSKLENHTSMPFLLPNWRLMIFCVTMTRSWHATLHRSAPHNQRTQSVQNHNDNRFSILACDRSLSHWKTLELTIIKLKQPILCRQKGRVFHYCCIFWLRIIVDCAKYSRFVNLSYHSFAALATSQCLFHLQISNPNLRIYWRPNKWSYIYGNKSAVSLNESFE